MITRKHIRNMKLCSALLSLNQSPSKKKEKVGATSLRYVNIMYSCATSFTLKSETRGHTKENLEAVPLFFSPT